MKCDYEFACAHGRMIVFVRDNLERRLVSYMMGMDGMSMQ